MATPRRFKPTDAFVDESVRGQRYLIPYMDGTAGAAAAAHLTD